MHQAILQRVEVLLSQGRIIDADKQIRTYLEEDPTSEYGRYLLAYILFFQGKSKDSEKLILQLQQESPENPSYIALLAEINLKEEELDAAEEKTDMLLSMFPSNVRFHNLKSRVKFSQRYYNEALKYANSALEIDPENLEALNQKTMISGLLGDRSSARNTINEALERNPEDPHTIANHANQLLKEGKVNDALNRFSEALRMNPTNSLARYGMQEAMKSKFWLYRLFYKYFSLMSKLTANGSWAFIIGTYVIYRILHHISNTNEMLAPFLTPLVYLLLAFFLLTWVINPLMNLYLMTNQYGRLLLDDDSKKMAILTGATLLIALICFCFFYNMQHPTLMYASIFFAAMMIPLGSFLSPYDENDRKKLTYFTMAIFGVGAIGLLLSNQTLISGAFLGLFGYQFYINSISISRNSRKG